MKTKIRRFVGGASWSLFTAGTLGIAASAQAQVSPYHQVMNQTPSYQAVDDRQPVLTASGHMHLAQVKVELAWCASPQLCSCHLQTRPMGSALEAQGAVPTEEAHDLALRLACRESGMRVIDSIRVDRRLSVAQVNKTVNVLHREATTALTQALPLHGKTISVSIWNKGQILLKGNVPSIEDKLTASRCLARIAGCSCVVNQLNVGDDGRPSARSLLSSHATNPMNRESTPVIAQQGPVALLNPEPIKPSIAQPITLVDHREAPAPMGAIPPVMPVQDKHANQGAPATIFFESQNQPTEMPVEKGVTGRIVFEANTTPEPVPAITPLVPQAAEAHGRRSVAGIANTAVTPPVPQGAEAHGRHPAAGIASTAVTSPVPQAAEAPKPQSQYYPTRWRRAEQAWRAPTQEQPKILVAQQVSDTAANSSANEHRDAVASAVSWNNGQTETAVKGAPAARLDNFTASAKPLDQGMSNPSMKLTPVANWQSAANPTQNQTVMMAKDAQAEATVPAPRPTPAPRTAVYPHKSEVPAGVPGTPALMVESATLRQEPAQGQAGSYAFRGVSNQPAQTAQPAAPRQEVTQRPADSYAFSGASVQETPPQKEPLPKSNDAYIAGGIILVDSSDPPVAPPAKPKHLEAPVVPQAQVERWVAPAAQKAKPGRLETPVVQKAKPEHFLRQTRLHQSIAKACGKKLRDVEVTLQADNKLLIRVKARTEAEGGQLSTRIFQMPELEPYQVSLDIPLAP